MRVCKGTSRAVWGWGRGRREGGRGTKGADASAPAPRLAELACWGRGRGSHQYRRVPLTPASVMLAGGPATAGSGGGPGGGSLLLAKKQPRSHCSGWNRRPLPKNQPPLRNRDRAASLPLETSPLLFLVSFSCSTTTSCVRGSQINTQPASFSLPPWNLAHHLCCCCAPCTPHPAKAPPAFALPAPRPASADPQARLERSSPTPSCFAWAVRCPWRRCSRELGGEGLLSSPRPHSLPARCS